MLVPADQILLAHVVDALKRSHAAGDFEITTASSDEIAPQTQLFLAGDGMRQQRPASSPCGNDHRSSDGALTRHCNGRSCVHASTHTSDAAAECCALIVHGHHQSLKRQAACDKHRTAYSHIQEDVGWRAVNWLPWAA